MTYQRRVRAALRTGRYVAVIKKVVADAAALELRAAEAEKSEGARLLALARRRRALAATLDAELAAYNATSERNIRRALAADAIVIDEAIRLAEAAENPRLAAALYRERLGRPASRALTPVEKAARRRVAAANGGKPAKPKGRFMPLHDARARGGPFAELAKWLAQGAGAGAATVGK